MHFEAPTPEPQRPDLEPWEIDAAEACVASFLASGRRFRNLTREDLVQEGLLEWLQERHRYSSLRGAAPRTFLNRVVINRLKDLLREELAEKRTAERTATSLNQAAGDGDGDLANLIADTDALTDPQRVAELRDLQERLDRIRGRLTQRERELLSGLLHGRTVREISRELATSTVTLNKDKHRIRLALEESGLSEFLDQGT